MNQIRTLLVWSGFYAGWGVFVYRWVFLEWTALESLPLAGFVTFFVYGCAALLYGIAFKERRDRYNGPDKFLGGIYVNLIIAVVKRDKKRASDVMEDLRAHVDVYLCRP